MYKNLISLCLCLSFFALGSSADPVAQTQCRTIHHTDADDSGTSYSNNKCLLICSIHGKLWPHNMSEGQKCPGLLGTSNVCKEGQCVSGQPPFVLGYIDIEMASAQLSKSAMVFADVCIQNASSSVSLPIADRTSCLSCDTAVVSPSTAPVFNKICTGSNQHLFVNYSRVTFEVWEQISNTNHNFAGGATALVSDIVAKGDNHKTINLPLASGDNSGKIAVRVTWTPK